MTIKNNLSAEEREILKGLKDETTILICSADKGKAVVVEDTETYIFKCSKNKWGRLWVCKRKLENSISNDSPEDCGSAEENGVDIIQQVEIILVNCSCTGKHV